MTDSGDAGAGAGDKRPGRLALDELLLGELTANKAVRLANNKARAGFDIMKTPAAI